jgi:subtilase family serine protease
MPIIAIDLPDYDFLHECFRYDAETGFLYWKERPESHFTTTGGHIRFNNVFAGKRAGKANKKFRSLRISTIDPNKSFLEHRIIWKMETGKDPVDQIDHINNNRFDNRIKNLRECSVSENCLNRRSKKVGYKGVQLIKKSGTYAAYITYKGKIIRLGYWSTEEEAAEVYALASKAFHGEFANCKPKSSLTGEWVY